VTDELLLAIDAGTGSARAVLFSPDGSQVAIGQREYSHPELPAVPGSQVFETEENWRLICECVREALAGVAADAVKAVAATSMREGMVLYDARGREIWACPNVDSRAGEEAGELVRSGAAQEIYDHAGDWVSITAPARFLWIARHEPDELDHPRRPGAVRQVEHPRARAERRIGGELAAEARQDPVGEHADVCDRRERVRLVLREPEEA